MKDTSMSDIGFHCLHIACMFNECLQLAITVYSNS